MVTAVRRWRLRHRCVAFAALGVALFVALPGCGASSPAPSQGAAPRIADVGQLLARHARAVRARSARDYLADVDPSAAAAPFRAQESGDIANLAQVPLARWSYLIDSTVHDPAVLAASRRRFGTTTLILQVTLSYALRYVDPQPSKHALWLTFVRRHGRTYLATDDDLATVGSPSWAGAWRFGPLAAARGDSTLALGPQRERARLPALAAAVDAAVPAVTAVWGRNWSRRVAVILSASPQEFAALTRAGTAIGDESAAAVTDGVDAAGQPYGQRLVLAPGALAELSTVGLGIVLRHEITHLATAASTAQPTPRWLVEGFADYVGNLSSGQSVAAAAPELRAVVIAGRVPQQLPSDIAFTASGSALARAYELSWLGCRLIAAKAGQAALVRFYRAVGTATSSSSEAIATALHAVLHESLATFTSQWRAYLKSELS